MVPVIDPHPGKTMLQCDVDVPLALIALYHQSRAIPVTFGPRCQVTGGACNGSKIDPSTYTQTDSSSYHPRPCLDTGATVALEKGRLRFASPLGETTSLAGSHRDTDPWSRETSVPISYPDIKEGTTREPGVQGY